MKRGLVVAHMMSNNGPGETKPFPSGDSGKEAEL